MHDQSLEQRLRSALQAEGDTLPLTITSAELERRLALRGRGRLSPMASLGLAAAVGAGLLGLAGIAGGWFEARQVVSPPSPSAFVVASPVPSVGPSATPGPAALPSLDDLVARIDEAAIVRAQAVGDEDGWVKQTPAGPRSVSFARIDVAGSYRVWTACLGPNVELVVNRASPTEPVERIPITCDTTLTTRQVGFEAGDALTVSSLEPTAWRVALEAPPRPAFHATEIAAEADPASDGSDLMDAIGESRAPDYGALLTGGGVFTPLEVGGVPPRTLYRVLFSCAGPRPVRYAFGNPEGGVGDLLSATQVECDGAAHEDVFSFPLVDGAPVFVTADARTAWWIRITSDPPPITIAPNEGGWTLHTANGPDYAVDGGLIETSQPGADDGGPVRVVVTCSGEAAATVTIDADGPASEPPQTFELDCTGHGDPTLTSEYRSATGSILTTIDPHGAAVWTAVTIQVRVPASPAP